MSVVKQIHPMESIKSLSCVDCGTQNCKFKTRTYPEFCLTTNLDQEDAAWAAERYGGKCRGGI